RKSSPYLAIPATGNGGPARIIASRIDIPVPTSGPTAPIRPAVEAGAVRTIVGSRRETAPAMARGGEAARDAPFDAWAGGPCGTSAGAAFPGAWEGGA